MDANGMDANGMTNGMDANGMDANGMDANGMTNGMDANGMADAAPGNGMYTGMATVTGATDGAQMITITATDASGNSRTATVSVMIDNTGPALSMASADPAMAANETVVTISVSTESGATVTADASAIGGDAALALAEGMDADMAGTGMYSAMVTVTDARTAIRWSQSPEPTRSGMRVKPLLSPLRLTTPRRRLALPPSRPTGH